ncbi:hypothetical protein ACFQJ7_01330 [Halovenus rubra]|uniref:Uncharacterized protein n=2 Tax=Halovenus rubra TaxID=869890 RepID=A0ACC7E0Y1_9EURY|nr:hypothetical protein [Halovenus rubra]
MADSVGQANPPDERIEGWPLPLRGAVYGVVAGLGTYVTVTLFVGIHVLTTANVTFSGIGIQTLFRATLGDFFSAHIGVTDGVVLGVAGVGTVPEPAYTFAVPLLLGYFGWLCHTGLTADTGQEAFLHGASIAIGYTLVVGLCLATLYNTARFAFVGIDTTRAVVLGGLVYPVVFGGLGGIGSYMTHVQS